MCFAIDLLSFTLIYFVNNMHTLCRLLIDSLAASFVAFIPRHDTATETEPPRADDLRDYVCILCVINRGSN